VLSTNRTVSPLVSALPDKFACENGACPDGRLPLSLWPRIETRRTAGAIGTRVGLSRASRSTPIPPRLRGPEMLGSNNPTWKGHNLSVFLDLRGQQSEGVPPNNPFQSRSPVSICRSFNGSNCVQQSTPNSENRERVSMTQMRGLGHLKSPVEIEDKSPCIQYC
jgi:hypothetical protein